MTTASSILITINTSWNIFHFRQGLIAALRSAGYRILTAAPDDAYTPALTKLVDAHYPIPMDNAGASPLRDAQLIRRYFSLLKRVRPSVMLTYTVKPNIYGALAARLTGTPVIANVSGLGTVFIRRSWITHVVMRLYRIAFQNVACVFFQNPEDRELFLSHKLVSPEKAILLPGSGINIDYFIPSPLPRNPSAPLSFVLMARLLWDKGIAEYVVAARLVKARYPEVTFHLVGPIGVQNRTAVTNRDIRDWVDEGVIIYDGETDDARGCLAAHDCVVLPSYREGMSRVLLEACAMGKPIITTDVPGCRQIVTERENGLLCKPRDAEDLARALIDFIALTPAQQATMGLSSRERAVREFDEKLVFKAYLDKVSQITGSR